MADEKEPAPENPPAPRPEKPNETEVEWGWSKKAANGDQGETRESNAE